MDIAYIHKFIASRDEAHQSLCKNLLMFNFARIKKFVHYFGGPYRGFYDFAVIDVALEYLTVKFTVERADPFLTTSIRPCKFLTNFLIMMILIYG